MFCVEACDFKFPKIAQEDEEFVAETVKNKLNTQFYIKLIG